MRWHSCVNAVTAGTTWSVVVNGDRRLHCMCPCNSFFIRFGECSLPSWLCFHRSSACMMNFCWLVKIISAACRNCPIQCRTCTNTQVVPAGPSVPAWAQSWGCLGCSSAAAIPWLASLVTSSLICQTRWTGAPSIPWPLVGPMWALLIISSCKKNFWGVPGTAQGVLWVTQHGVCTAQPLSPAALRLQPQFRGHHTYLLRGVIGHRVLRGLVENTWRLCISWWDLPSWPVVCVPPQTQIDAFLSVLGSHIHRLVLCNVLLCASSATRNPKCSHCPSKGFFSAALSTTTRDVIWASCFSEKDKGQLIVKIMAFTEKEKFIFWLPICVQWQSGQNLNWINLEPSVMSSSWYKTAN